MVRPNDGIDKVIELTNIWIDKATELMNVGIDRATELMNVGIDRAIELMNVGIDRAIEVLNGWASEATGPTEDGTEQAIEGTGALIAEGTIRIDHVRITIRIEGVIVIIKGIIGTTTDTVDIGIHGPIIDIIDMVNIRKPFSN